MRNNRFELARLFIESKQFIIHRQQLRNKLFLAFAILLNHYADIPPRIQRIILFFDFLWRGEFAQAGDVFVLRVGKAFLQPVDMLKVQFGVFHILMQFFQRGFKCLYVVKSNWTR